MLQVYEVSLCTALTCLTKELLNLNVLSHWLHGKFSAEVSETSHFFEKLNVSTFTGGLEDFFFFSNSSSCSSSLFSWGCISISAILDDLLVGRSNFGFLTLIFFFSSLLSFFGLCPKASLNFAFFSWMFFCLPNNWLEKNYLYIIMILPQNFIRTEDHHLCHFSGFHSSRMIFWKTIQMIAFWPLL